MGELHQKIMEIGRDQAIKQATDAQERRRLEWAAEILGVERSRRNYLHAGFAIISLPHSKPKDDRSGKAVTLQNGDARLVLHQRPIDWGDDGSPIYAGLPYGPKARLIMMYIQTYAVRNKSRNIVLGDSMSAWIKRLGYQNVNGGERGVIGAVHEQARRIARCEFTMVWDKADGSGRKMADQSLAKGLDLFAFGDGDDEEENRQLSLLPPAANEVKPAKKRKYNWVREIELGEEFYDSIMQNKVTLSEEAIAKLKGSAWALDIYTWLSYRLRSVNKPTKALPWEMIREQFASKLYKDNVSAFRNTVFLPQLQDVLAVFPEAKVEWDEKGLIMHPLRRLENTFHQVLLPPASAA